MCSCRRGAGSGSRGRDYISGVYRALGSLRRQQTFARLPSAAPLQQKTGHVVIIVVVIIIIVIIIVVVIIVVVV